MPKMFNFDADNYAGAFADFGYMHIPGGLFEEFHAQLVKYAEDR